MLSCAGHEDVSGRLKAIQDTLPQVHPSVVKVMRYLFRFLYKVSQHMSENKMTSANLALVFGPTLTRAPDDMDPRQLHNDVPAVNMLIQLCIDHHFQVHVHTCIYIILLYIHVLYMYSTVSRYVHTVHVHIHVHVHVHVPTHVHVLTVPMYMYMYVLCTVHVHVHVHILIVSRYICTCMYMYMYLVYMYMYVLYILDD